MRWLYALVALLAGMAFNLLLERLGAAPLQASGAPPAAATPATLEQLVQGRLKIVDLCWPLNPQSAYWPGDNYKPFELHTIATLERNGVLSKAFSSPEHLGTHLDAPNHFERMRASVDQIPPEQLFAPGVLIDVSASVAADSDYRVTVDDLRRYEATHGQIPQAAIVLAYTGWSRFWNTPARYQGKDVMNQLHFPGFSAEAVEWLIEQRHIRGVGLDTMSVDYGLSRDFVVHHLLGRANCLGLENLSQLDKLPPRDFFLFVAPMKIETGSGGPARVFAVLP
jgi:kynurenine formamidase